jgi:hypothetical protein
MNKRKEKKDKKNKNEEEEALLTLGGTELEEGQNFQY